MPILVWNYFLISGILGKVLPKPEEIDLVHFSDAPALSSLPENASRTIHEAFSDWDLYPRISQSQLSVLPSRPQKTAWLATLATQKLQEPLHASNIGSFERGSKRIKSGGLIGRLEGLIKSIVTEGNVLPVKYSGKKVARIPAEEIGGEFYRNYYVVSTWSDTFSVQNRVTKCLDVFVVASCVCVDISGRILPEQPHCIVFLKEKNTVSVSGSSFIRVYGESTSICLAKEDLANAAFSDLLPCPIYFVTNFIALNSQLVDQIAYDEAIDYVLLHPQLRFDQVVLESAERQLNFLPKKGVDAFEKSLVFFSALRPYSLICNVAARIQYVYCEPYFFAFEFFWF